MTAKETLRERYEKHKAVFPVGSPVQMRVDTVAMREILKEGHPKTFNKLDKHLVENTPTHVLLSGEEIETLLNYVPPEPAKDEAADVHGRGAKDVDDKTHGRAHRQRSRKDAD